MSAVNSASQKPPISIPYKPPISIPYMSNSDIDQYVTYTGLAILTAEIMKMCKFGSHGTILFLLTSESSKYKFLTYPK